MVLRGYIRVAIATRIAVIIVSTPQSSCMLGDLDLPGMLNLGVLIDPKADRLRAGRFVCVGEDSSFYLRNLATGALM